MKVFNLRGFDNKSNIALNEAIAIASKHKFDSVTSCHLLYVLLRSKEIEEKFEFDTLVTREHYTDYFENILDNRLKAMVGQQGKELGIEELSEEIKHIISETVSKCGKNGRAVTIFDLYRGIITAEHSEAWNILKMIGVNMESVINNLDDPLEDMGVTSQFAVNYNALAKNGKFDPVEDRDDVINSVIEVLGRRIKNNPCIVGEAGVGKTAIIEGLAQRLNNGEVPSYLKGKHIISVDISSMVAGAKYRGDFEARLNGVLEEAASNKNVILFFDEMHMLAEAGAGSLESSMTAANILKPAISRGDVQIIGATTPAEYKKFIENDKAFERRLQPVQINEPTVESAYKMVKAVIHKYNEFHNCEVSDETIKSAVNLSDRYIADKKLPDKAITIIDETAASIKRKQDTNGKKFIITTSDIKNTISKLTGIDINELDDASRDKIKSLEGNLKKHVIGQDKAVEVVSKAIKRSKAGIKDPSRPIGSFLFVGPTGVGKTELTKALSIEFSGGTKNMVRFDMSEFMEKHSVSRLIGSPPGYVGYGEGGQLTEAIRKNPYSVILFDEIEKAHPDVFNIMLQILDDGVLTDSEGTRVDFKNSIIIMTSNAGYGQTIKKTSNIGFGTVEVVETQDDVETKATKELEKTFRPEFINRLDKIVVFNSLSKADCEKIVGLEMNKLAKRVKSKDIELTWDDNLVEHILNIGYSERYGARNLKRKIQAHIEDVLADHIIDGNLDGCEYVHITYEDGNIKVLPQISIDSAIDTSLSGVIIGDSDETVNKELVGAGK